MLRTTTKTSRIALALALGMAAAAGCDIPVFRYALDRWPADAFRLEAPALVLRAEPLATEIRNLTGGSGLNLETAVSASGARLFFPAHVRGAARPVWEGELTPATYRTLTDSPARRELAKRILRGDSAVWVLVEGGPAAASDAAASRLENRLRFLESATGIPALDPNDPGSRLGPGPELKVQLSFLRLKRDDPAEAALITQLAGPPGLKSFPAGEPFIAVVFGRGRVLGAWPKDRLNEEFIEESTRFLLGSCSCEVKSQNPGWDLLLRVDWDEELKRVGAARAAAAGSSEKPARLLQPETVVIKPREASR